MSPTAGERPDALAALGGLSMEQLRDFVELFESKFSVRAVDDERRLRRLHHHELATLLGKLLRTRTSASAWKDPRGGRAVTRFTLVLPGDRNLPLVPFAHYLSTIDRLYARCADYYFEPRARLEVREVRRGSIEILLGLFDWHSAAVAALFLASVKALGGLARSGTESVKNLAEAYKSYQEGSEIRERRARTRGEERARADAAESLNRIAAEIAASMDGPPAAPTLRAVVYDVLGPEAPSPDFEEAAIFAARFGGQVYADPADVALAGAPSLPAPPSEHRID